MKKIYAIDTWRRIKRTGVTFLSIILITCLGLASYLGIVFARMSMEKTGDYYYTKSKFHNYEITYNYGITEADLEKIGEIEGIDTVEGVYRTTGFLKTEDKKRLVTVQSVTEKVDIATVLEGRLPETQDEIVIEKVMSEEDNISIGDVLEIDCESKDGTDLLLEKKFKVVGVAEHPAYSCNYVYSRRGISEKGNGNCLNYFLVSPHAFDMEETDECYQSAIVWSDALKQYNCISDQYERESDRFKEKINAISKQQSQQRYNSVVEDADKEVTAAEEELSEAERELNSYKADISQGESDIEEFREELRKLKEQYPDSSLVNGQEEALNAAEEELKENKERYDEAEKTYKENVNKLEEAKESLAELAEIDWNIYDRGANVSYAMYVDNAEGLGKLSFSFAFVYIVVAYMVCYSSIGRMITKQKVLIGTQKALGFRPWEIQLQYLAYVWVCTFWGCIFGVIWAVFFVQNISLNSYKPIYYFEDYIMVCDIPMTAIVSACAFVLSTAASLIACRRQMKKSAVLLLKDEAVGDGKEFFFEKWFLWRKISLFKRTVIKNLLNEKRHMVTIIIGIAGCTALMIIGFTLKFAISDVKEEQFNEIQRFDVSLQVEADTDSQIYEEELDKFANIEYIHFMDKMVGVSLNKKDNIIADLLCADAVEMNKFFLLEDEGTKKSVTQYSDGVLISANTARYYDIEVGDKVEIMKENGENVSVPVAGIVKNYVCHFLMMTPEYYLEVMNEDIKNNIYFIQLNGTDADVLEKALEAKEGYIALSGKEMGISIFNNIADSLNSVIIVMICLSAVMALIVVLNLMVMYINEKSKTLAVMRINGFSVRQTKAFINFSNVILNIVGLGVGAAVGIVLGIQIVTIIENDCVTYNRAPNFTACVIGCGICIFYSVFVGVIANRKINHLPLTNLNRFE